MHGDVQFFAQTSPKQMFKDFSCPGNPAFDLAALEAIPEYDFGQSSPRDWDA